MVNNPSFPENIVSWLEARRALNLFLVPAYFLFILFMHNPMVHVSMWVEGHLSLPVYNKATAVVYLLFLFVLSWVLWRQFPRYKENQKLKIFYLLTTIALVIIHSRFMFESNIEIIHSFEFTFLALLLFPLSRRFGAAIFFALPFMLVDEWYQYIKLYPDWNDYFDLNDVVMDTYGCALTMCVIFMMGVRPQGNSKPFWQRPEFIGLVTLGVVVGVLFALNIIVPYMSQKTSATWLVMNERLSPEPFLRAHPTHNIMYHVMKPLEGLLVIALLHLFYFGLDSFRSGNTA